MSPTEGTIENFDIYRSPLTSEPHIGQGQLSWLPVLRAAAAVAQLTYAQIQPILSLKYE